MHELAAALAEFLPDAGVGFAYPQINPPGALPVGAVESRRREFAAGRIAAAQALARFGVTAEVPMGDDRAPIWPAGLVGSITHTRDVALAVVVENGLIGIDLERDNALARDLWDDVLLPEEMDLAEGYPPCATSVFCAKEAVFKAQYPLTRQMFGFDRLTVIPGVTSFIARFRADTGPIRAGTTWNGELIRALGHTLAVCRI